MLGRSGVEVRPETYAIVSLSSSEWLSLLQDSSLSPSGQVPYIILSDPLEVTLVLAEAEFERIRGAVKDARFEVGYRLLTFTLEMDLTVVGFLAEITRILAACGIPVLAISSFSRDHILIRQSDLAAALKALGPHMSGLC